MQEIIKQRREADRTDAVIVAAAERVWAEIEWPETAFTPLGLKIG